MTSVDYGKKLTKLTERELQVLRLVCEGKRYKNVGDILVISEKTVKSHMYRIYGKLGLRKYEKPERQKILFQEVCIILENEDIEPVEEDEEDLEEILEEDDDDEIMRMVEEDEYPIVPVTPLPLAPDDPPPHRGFRRFLLGVLIGTVLMSIIYFVFSRTNTGNTETDFSATIEALVAERSAEQEEDTGSEINQSESTPTVKEVVVVVTTTSPPISPTPLPPTQTLTPTPPPDTPNDSILEVGEWWRTDGVWVRLSKVDFGTGSVGIILEMWNQTGDQLLFKWSPSINFILVDNTGHQYEINSLNTSSDNEIVDANDLKEIRKVYTTYTAYSEDDHFFDSSVNELFLTVENFSRISHAEWRIPVSK